MAHIRSVERFTYGIGLLLIVSGLVHAAILLGRGDSWEGPLSFRKPATFGLSFGLTLINVTLLASLLPLAERSRLRLLGVFAAACVLETFLVSMQAWRGVPSHFNMSTPFDTAVAQMLAIGGFALVVVIVLVAIAAFRHGSSLPAPMRTALQAGFLALVASQIAGGIMIATGVRQVIGGDPQRAYEIGGWLKPVHAVLMHGILVLPLLAWLAMRVGWNVRAQVQAMRVAIASYLLAIVAAVVIAFRS